MGDGDGGVGKRVSGSGSEGAVRVVQGADNNRAIYCDYQSHTLRLPGSHTEIIRAIR